MQKFDRLPALPLITNDPYFSIWMPGDTFTAAEAIHWTGQEKPLTGHLVIDGRRFLFLGHSASIPPCKPLTRRPPPPRPRP